jgi:DNA-directed RNA polymerase sigma subunit (sigma70/sigma32)
MRAVHPAPDINAVETALRQLSPRAERLLRTRFGIGLPAQHSCGDPSVIPRRRLRQLEASAFRRLRLNALASQPS